MWPPQLQQTQAAGYYEKLASEGKVAPGRVIVQLDEQQNGQDGQGQLEAHSVDALARLTQADDPVPSFFSSNLRAGQTLDEAIAELRSQSGVKYAGPDFIYRAAAEPLFGYQWALRNTGQVVGGTAGTIDADIDGPEAWTDGTGSASTIVAVVDSGVDHSHVDLATNIWANPGQACGSGDGDGNGFIGDCKGYDFVSAFGGSGSNAPRDDDPSPCGTDITLPNTGDCNGVDDNGDGSADNFAVHGTHVAGIVAAPQNLAGISGVAPDVTIMPVRALTEDGTGTTTDVVAAMNYAIDEGADIINMSFGSDLYDTSFDSVILAAESAQVVLVAAAGNANENLVTGSDCDSPVCNDDPGGSGLNAVLSVAATTNKDRKAGFSNYSTENWVDVAAPGQSIISTCYDNPGTPACGTNLGAGGKYDTISGTSQATPHVAGIAALVRSISPGLTADEVRQIVRNTGDDISAANVGLAACGGLDCITGDNGTLGQNRVNAANVFNPQVVSMQPSTGTRGASDLSVSILGANTSFSNGSIISFGSGITINSFSCNTTKNCTALINITDAAPLGEHSVSVTSGSQIASSVSPFIVDDAILRIAGHNRIGTAIEISKNGYPIAESADAVLIARQDAFPDSLAGGPLAALANGPLLFTSTGKLDSYTKDELLRVLETTCDAEPDIYILGQTAAISASVEAELKTYHPECWQVKRLGGVNRVDTAVSIAEEEHALRGGPPDSVVVATQSVFADALAAGVPAADSSIDPKRMPILITDRSNLSAGTANFLEVYKNSISKVYVIGGDAAVNNAVFNQIKTYESNVERISGADRYETAQNVAEYFYADPISVSIASGLNFPDAMAGNWHSAARQSPILLVRGGETPQATIDYIILHDQSLLGGFMYGGTAVIPEDVKLLLESII
ncbi:MAG: S8 family serine peptidase [Parcubacteria group bacterium]